MIKEQITASEEETLQAGYRFGEQLEPGDVVCLRGDLGAGKTHFIKGVASRFGFDPDRVSSPTYTLINEYNAELSLYHFDCYRLKSEREALEIGAEEYFYGDGLSMVEWPEKIEGLIPSEAIWIDISHLPDGKRKIEIHQ